MQTWHVPVLFALAGTQCLLTTTQLVYYCIMFNSAYEPVAQIQVHTEYTQMVVAAVLEALTLLSLIETVLKIIVCINLDRPTASLSHSHVKSEGGASRLCLLSLQLVHQRIAYPFIVLLQLSCFGLNLFLIGRIEWFVWLLELILFVLQIIFVCVLLAYKSQDPSDSVTQARNEQPIGCCWMSRHWGNQAKNRRFIYASWSQEQKYWTIPILIVFLIYFITFLVSLSQSFGTDGGFYTSQQLDAMNQNVESLDSFLSMNSSRETVILLLFDGLGFNEVTTQSDWQTVLHSTSFSPDIGLMLMTAQIPTMSIPNWITLLSGAAPEISGTLGNIEAFSSLLAPFLTNIDTFWNTSTLVATFNQTTLLYNTPMPVPAYLIGGTWFYDLIADQVAPFQYSINTPGTATGDGLQAEIEQDIARASLTLELIGGPRAPPVLTLSYFNEPDGCGHEFGLGSHYSVCAGRMALVFQSVLDTLAFHDRLNGTTVIAFADHGHVTAGGHGGTSQGVANTPLVVYRHNSGFASALAGESTDSLNFASTVTGMLRIPIPRQSQGEPIADIILPTVTGFCDIAPGCTVPVSICLKMDLFQQRRQLTNNFYRQTGTSLVTLQSTEENNPVMIMARPAGDLYGTPLDQIYIAALCASPGDPVVQAQVLASLDYNVGQLNELYNSQRTFTWACLLARNYVVNFFIASLGVLWVVQRMSRFSIIGNPCPARRTTASTSENESLIKRVEGAQPVQSPIGKKSRPRLQMQACIVSVCFFVLYNIVEFTVFTVAGIVYGYPTMDSSFLHHPDVIWRFLYITVLPGIIMVFIFHRAFVWYWIESPDVDDFIMQKRGQGWACNSAAYDCCGCFSHYTVQFFRFIFVDFSTWSNYVTDWGPVYLFRTYLLVLAFAMCIVIMLLEGVFTCVIPVVFDLTFIDETGWNLRFWVITYMFMTLPMVFGSYIIWLCAPSAVRDELGKCNINILANLQIERVKGGTSDHDTHTY